MLNHSKIVGAENKACIAEIHTQDPVIGGSWCGSKMTPQEPPVILNENMVTRWSLINYIHYGINKIRHIKICVHSRLYIQY